MKQNNKCRKCGTVNLPYKEIARESCCGRKYKVLIYQCVMCGTRYERVKS